MLYTGPFFIAYENRPTWIVFYPYTQPRFSYICIPAKFEAYNCMVLIPESKVDKKYLLQLGSTTDGTTTIRHTGHVTTHYMIYHPFDLYFK
jgi:hypothetical protein